MSDEFEIRADGVRARKDRWEVGIRRIVALLWGNRHAFEVDEVVEAVRVLIPEPKLDDEGLVQAVLGMPAVAPYAWAVSGLGMPFYGEHAEADARNEARRVGGDARVFPLYKGV